MAKTVPSINECSGYLALLLLSLLLVILPACSDSGDEDSNPTGVDSDSGDGGEGGNTGSSGISFSATSYTVAENTPSIAISVKRAGGASEAVSVDYAVTSGTAVDGEDFAATSGTLNWNANDSAAKTFDVQIFADDAVEGDETVTLALSNPSSNTSLGAENTATLNISDFVVGECNAEITDGKITEDTTLSEPCYKVPKGISVQNPAQLTVSPGVKLVFAAGTGLGVKEGASLYAVGTAEQPILFTAADPSPGYWEGIGFAKSISTGNQLDYVTVEYGVININTYSRASSPTRISVKNTISRYASNLGVYFHNTSLIVDAFEGNTLTANNRPIVLPSEMVGLLGTDSSYSGNTDDRIHVEDSDISTAQTWKKLDAPYFLGSSSAYRVHAALTLEAGTSLTFNSGAALRVKSDGSLTAVGNAEEPILFTGLEKTPGYWHSIGFAESNSSNNQLDYVTVEYAGSGDPSASANIRSYCRASTPTRFSVTNSIIKDSFGWGIQKYGTEESGCYITLSNNTFSNNASGDVSQP